MTPLAEPPPPAKAAPPGWNLGPCQIEALEMLLESHDRWHAFMRNSPAAMWLKGVDGAYVCANPVAETEFLGASGPVMGGTDLDFLPESAAQALRANDQSVLRIGAGLNCIEKVPGKDGVERTWFVARFPFSDRNGDAFVGGVAFDITHRVESERKAADGVEKFRAVFDSAPCGMAIVAGGCIVQANEACRDLFGLPKNEELAGLPLAGQFDAGAWAELAAGFARIETGGMAWPGGELAGVRRDGSRIGLRVRMSRIELGGRTAAVVFMTDTGQKAVAEAAAAKGEPELETVHRFKNILAVIKVHATLLHAKNLPAGAAECAREIATALEAGDEILRRARG